MTSKYEQTELLLEALKRALREQGVTYRELGRKIGLSEPSVKRTFSSRRITLDRLERMCRAAGMSIFELSREAEIGAEAEVYQLTIAQERRLVRDAALFYFFWMLVSRHSLAAIRRRYRMNDAQVRGYLAEGTPMARSNVWSRDRCRRS
jgi:transcriptional regulator with XRE-family HTH domain